MRGTPAEAVFSQAVNDTTKAILAESVRNIKKNSSSTSGKLLSSGRVEAVAVTSSNVIGGVSYNAMYAYFVEFGRRAGKMPPITDILAWVEKRGIFRTYSIKTKRATAKTAAQSSQEASFAYAVAKSIGKKGTKAQPFLYPAFASKSRQLGTYLKKHYGNFINNL